MEKFSIERPYFQAHLRKMHGNIFNHASPPARRGRVGIHARSAFSEDVTRLSIPGPPGSADQALWSLALSRHPSGAPGNSERVLLGVVRALIGAVALVAGRLRGRQDRRALQR